MTSCSGLAVRRDDRRVDPPHRVDRVTGRRDDVLQPAGHGVHGLPARNELRVELGHARPSRRRRAGRTGLATRDDDRHATSCWSIGSAASTGSSGGMPCRAIPLRDARGEIDLWIGTATDIEDQKQLELASAPRGAGGHGGGHPAAEHRGGHPGRFQAGRSRPEGRSNQSDAGRHRRPVGRGVHRPAPSPSSCPTSGRSSRPSIGAYSRAKRSATSR